MHSKRILYHILDNPMGKNHGNMTWSLQLLKYFRKRGFDVDFVSDRDWGMWSNMDIKAFEKTGLARSVHILDRKPSKKNLLRYFFLHKLPHFFIKRKAGFYRPSIHDHITLFYQKQFNEILKKGKYDFVYINYVTCSNLIKDNPYVGKAIKIIDTHDFFTSQFQKQRGFNIGKAFKEEIERLSLFDDIWTVSVEEHYIFSQFCNRKVSLVQTMLEKPSLNLMLSATEKEYDIVYVASDIIHNKISANWFFTEVYPQLAPDLKIVVIGKITDHIPDFANVHKIRFVDDLGSMYAKSRIAICPMLSGTGIKVKVVEALSFGLPIVCSPRGVDGLLNKVNNGCTIAENEKQFASAISHLLNDTVLYARESQLAEASFDLFFSTQSAYKKLDTIFGAGETTKSTGLNLSETE